MKKFIQLMIILTLTSSLYSAELPKEIILAGGRKIENSYMKFILDIETEAFKRLGVKLKYEIYPPNRIVYLADNGLVDGHLGRVYKYSDSHPNLLRVDEIIIKQVYSAFSLDKNISLKNWTSLKNSNFIIERRLGIKAVENGLKGVVEANNISVAKNIEIAVKKLIYGRTDLYIDARIFVHDFLNSDEGKTLKDKIHEVAIMEEIAIYIFLHKKHHDLIPKLEKELVNMKKEGRFDYYKNKYKLNFNW